MTAYRNGQRVELYGLRYGFEYLNGEIGIVTLATDRGDKCCAVYDVILTNGQRWTTCDCHMKPAEEPKLNATTRMKVDWDRVAWRPNLERLPEYISAELNRRRLARGW